MSGSGKNVLLTAAALSAIAALLHIGCIIFGAPWYRFFGAGEKMAQMALAGDPTPTLITSGIVLVLTIWALYALSGAGVVRRLPLLRTGLVVITSIYLTRGAAIIPVLILYPQDATSFMWWSSGICLAIGLVHAVGLARAWRSLS